MFSHQESQKGDYVFKHFIFKPEPRISKAVTHDTDFSVNKYLYYRWKIQSRDITSETYA